MTIAEWLRSSIKAKGITQADLSRLTGISKSRISCYLRGTYEPKFDAFAALAAALGKRHNALDYLNERIRHHMVTIYGKE